MRFVHVFVLCVLVFELATAASFAHAQTSALPVGVTVKELEQEVEVSYSYSAVMGSGTYKVGNRRISMFRLPFNWTQRDATDESAGWTWLFPVVVGYDDLSNVGSDWIGALLPSQLITLSVLPGVEYVYPISERWQIKPFVQLGGGRDFSVNETFYMANFGVRSLARFDIRPGWALRWGNMFRRAGERQVHSGDKAAFSVFDSGLDLRRDTPWKIFGKGVDLGTYYIYQRYIPHWSTSQAPDLEANTIELHEFGLSVGLKRPHKILGIEFQRFRLGYKKGADVRGWTVGTEFPF